MAVCGDSTGAEGALGASLPLITAEGPLIFCFLESFFQNIFEITPAVEHRNDL